MSGLPWAPDFEVYPSDRLIVDAAVEDGCVCVRWDDGRESRFHPFLLRENSPDAETIHLQSREMLISPLDLPDNLRAESAAIDGDGALEVVWSHGGRRSRYHPGWLRAHAWFPQDEEKAVEAPVLWDAADLDAPPTFDGQRALDQDEAFLDWLEALRDYGVARLQGLPQRHGLLEDVVRRIGPIRESNFGRTYTLQIKDNPDSNAFTSSALLQHIDMPTRECPHGLQFLYCRRNTTTGGEGVYVDGYRIAEDMRREEPESFDALSTIVWDFNNRSRTSDYRASGPVIRLDGAGAVTEIRLTPWLRAPLKAPIEVQDRAYRSVRAFMRRAQDPRYQLVFAYRPGDLLAFDNRRVLHGRKGYDAKGGERFIEGAYADRDDLHSRIRTLRRRLRSRELAEAAE